MKKVTTRTGMILLAIAIVLFVVVRAMKFAHVTSRERPARESR